MVGVLLYIQYRALSQKQVLQNVEKKQVLEQSRKGMSVCVPLTVILPAEPAVSSCLLLVVVVLFFQSPILASPAGWSRLAANTQTSTHKQMGKWTYCKSAETHTV